MKFNPFLLSWTKFLQTDYKAILCTVVLVSLLFFVTLPAGFAACVVSCKNNLNVSLGNEGVATLTPWILLQDPSCDPSTFTVDITDPNGNSVGNTLTCAHIGLTMTATVTQTSSGNSCSTTITVVDNISPQISCVNTTVLCIQATDPQSIGYPVATDNCTSFTNADLTYIDSFEDLACFTVIGTDTITSQITRVWSVTDEAGNTQTCNQMIYLRRATIADVDFPDNLDGFANPSLDCNQDPSDLSLTGEPSIEGILLDNEGNCELVTSFSDQIIPMCGSGYRILRTWTVIDYCSDEFTLDVQIIKVIDTTAPQINCPADFTVSTTTNSCEAIVNLPLATATDDCSNFNILPIWEFGTGYGPFYNVPLGTHTITYISTDECDNTSTCTMTVTVEDAVAPTPVCNSLTSIDLSVQGGAVLNAIVFDDNSFDNCGIDSYLISRNGQDYLPTVTFNCDDIANSPIAVDLRVIDLAGNYNECTVYVTVEDKINPALLCPASISLECSADLTDLALTGSPLYSDNCAIDSLSYADVIEVNDCNVGTVYRTWTVVDNSGNTASCTQVITLEDTTPFSVVFPSNYNTNVCGAATDTSLTGSPVLINYDCESISLTYTDDLVSTSASCYHIFRTWSVYDWCTFDPNDGTDNGYWTAVQVIEVTDEEAPQLLVPEDVTVDMFANDCSGTIVTLSAATAIDCNPQVEIVNDSPYALNGGADASGFYPPGTHTINFSAMDGCNNSDMGSMQITVVDAKAPTPVTVSGLSVSLMSNGMVAINAEQLNVSSYDNCTASENLILSVSPNEFTCDDLGEQIVNFTVEDEAGNSAFVQVTITVEDNNFNCTVPTVSVNGFILNEDGEEVQWVDNQLTGDVEASASSDELGYFEIQEVPVGGDYTLTPEKDIFDGNGVSTFDLIFIQRHILGIQPLNSPYKIIAADINHNGSVSAFDMVYLRKLILQIDTAFTNNTSWRFVEASYVFPDPNNPFLTSFPESIEISGLETDYYAEFIGVKIGDVNGNSNGNALTGSGGDAREELSPLILQIPDREIAAGEIIRVPIQAAQAEKRLGYQFTLGFDKQVLDFVEMSTGNLPHLTAENFGYTHLDQGMINCNWVSPEGTDLEAGMDLFYLTFQAKEKGRLSDLIQLNTRFLQAEAYTTDLQVTSLNLQFEQAEETPVVAAGLKNSPNPFSSYTEISFVFEQKTPASLQITNGQGQILWEKAQDWEEGKNTVRIDPTYLPVAGIYFYYLVYADGSRSEIRKMMRQ